jgi:hypothetical protein
MFCVMARKGKRKMEAEVDFRSLGLGLTWLGDFASAELNICG